MVSTVRRRRELSARRARAAREPNVRTILHEICRPVSLLRRVHGCTLLYPFFPSYPARPRLYNVHSTSVYSVCTVSLRNTGFSPTGFSCSFYYTRVGTSTAHLCATSHLSLPPPYFSRFFFSLPFVHLFLVARFCRCPGTGLFVFI